MQGMPERSENEFNLAIQAENFDEATARTKARAEQNGGLDTALLRQITSAILIFPTGEVSLKLKNGQILKRSDLT